MIKFNLKRKIIKGFDKWSFSYSKDVVPKLMRRGHGYEQLAKNIIEYSFPKLGAELLEIGTGTGVLGNELKQYRPDLKIIGIDISKKMLYGAKEMGIYNTLLQCDAEDLPFQSNLFQYIYIRA